MAKNLTGSSLSKQYSRQDAWVRQNRERITITMPIGTRERVSEVSDLPFNAFVREAIDHYIDELKHPAENVEE